jgi:integrase
MTTNIPTERLLEIVANSERLGDNTKAIYANAIRRFDAFAGGERSQVLVEQFGKHLLKKVTPQTAHKLLSGLRYVGGRLADLRLGLDFTFGIEMPKRIAGKRRESPTSLEVQAVRRACVDDVAIQGLRDLAMVDLIAIGAASRCNEVATANKGDYNSRTRILAVHRKGGWTQECYLDPGTCRVLDRWLDVRGKVAPDDPLFVAIHPSTLDRPLLGGRLSGSGVRYIISTRAKQAAISSRLTPHHLRHAFFALGLRAGLPLERLAEAAGHRGPTDRSPAVSVTYRHDLLAREAPVGVSIRNLLEAEPSN